MALGRTDYICQVWPVPSLPKYLCQSEKRSLNALMCCYAQRGFAIVSLCNLPSLHNCARGPGDVSGYREEQTPERHPWGLSSVEVCTVMAGP